MLIDDWVNSNNHDDYVCEKAAKTITSLTRITYVQQIDADQYATTRRLLVNVSMSVLWYVVPVWAAGQLSWRNMSWLNCTYRLIAMRVASVYLIVFTEAVCVIVGIIPMKIVLEEDCEYYSHQGTTRADCIREWQLG